MKVVIRELPKSIKVENIENELTKTGFDIIKTVQMISRQVLPLFLLHLPKNENAKKILTLKSLFKIRIDIENYRAPRKAEQCWKCQGFFHIAALCFMVPRCVGYGEPH